MERNYGIDLLKGLCMYMIVIFHVIGHGGVLEGTNYFSFSYEMVRFIRILVICAVNCFAMISGYLMLEQNEIVFKVRRIFILWIQV